MSSTTALYASVGPRLTRYLADVDRCTLTPSTSVVLPAKVQYAWRHSTLPVLYVVCSDRLNKVDYGTDHFLCAVRIDAVDGAMSVLGEPRRLSNRPVHVTTDNTAEHVLVAFNKPAGVEVHRVDPAGALGERVPQRDDLDVGVFPHQVRVTPDNRFVILVTRGRPGKSPERMEAPGALKIFTYRDGTLHDHESVAAGDGYRYGARHLDFHTSEPWVYVSLELQNELHVHSRVGDRISAEPLFTHPLFETPTDPPRGHQAAGTVHVHPHGHAVYCANRGNGAEPLDGRSVVVGADNTLAVFSIDPRTGQPTLLQHIESGGVNARTFSLDPSGRMLVAANAESHWVTPALDAPIRRVSANLATFRVLEDGRLELLHRYEMDPVPGQKLFWVAFES